MLKCVIQLSFMQDIDYIIEQFEDSPYQFLMDNRGPCLVREFNYITTKPLILEAVAMDLIERNIRMDSINVYKL